jgi:hypothetical protein
VQPEQVPVTPLATGHDSDIDLGIPSVKQVLVLITAEEDDVFPEDED